ncbi:uncharacterized protein LOC101459717 isoform X1 [Ceratitis capitata]|uniref:uncharacterized protein LOC101459717 isoform X1 n=2 Tax=Ceratitis capitata TaxID=7213 RepID=UPI000329BD7B|nr:uncharacterized protein LOC101459717 isoform X1 [Ceratitis capitata]XP_012158313.1 uncharacterized protein LOC101459717 isoform X1 [Ceratitis capitata]
MLPTMALKYQPSVVSWALFLLTLSGYSAAQMLYENDFCDFAGYEGTCLPTSKCFHLQSIMEELGLKSYNVGRCGFTITEELICCPKWPTPLQMPPVQLPPELPNEFVDFSKGFTLPTSQGGEETIQNPWQNVSLDDKINAIFSGATSNNNGVLNDVALWNVNVNENSNGLLNESTPVLSENTVEILNKQPEKTENLDDILKKLFDGAPAVSEKKNQGLLPENTVLDENISERAQNIFGGNTDSDGKLNQNASSGRLIKDEEVNERIKNIFNVNPAPVETNSDQPKDPIDADQAPGDSLNERLKNIFNLNQVQDENPLNPQQDIVSVNRSTDGNVNRNLLTGNIPRDEITNENSKNIFNEPREEFIGSSNTDHLPDEKLAEGINKLDGDLNEKWKNVFNGSSIVDENHITEPLTKSIDDKRREGIINTNQLNVNPVGLGDKVTEKNLSTNSFAGNFSPNGKLSSEIQNPTVKDFNPAISLEGNPWLDNNQFNGNLASPVLGQEVKPIPVPIESGNLMPSGDTKVRDRVEIETSKNVFEENSDFAAAAETDSSNGAFNWKPVTVADTKAAGDNEFQEKTPSKYEPSNIPYPAVPVGDITVGSDNIYLDTELQETPSKYEPSNIPYSPDIPPPPYIESTFNKDSSESDSESSESISFSSEYAGNAKHFELHNNKDYFNNLPSIHQFNQPQPPQENNGLFYGPPPPYGHAFNDNPQNIPIVDQENDNQNGNSRFKSNARHRDSMIHEVIRDSAFDLANRLVQTRQKVINNLKTVNPFRNYVIQTRNERRRSRNRNRFPWH